MGQTKNNGAAENLAANRNYKSTVFAMLFGDRERLLGLYNAISGKNYQDPEASAGPEGPAAVGSLYGKDERNTAGADSSAAEHQPES